MRNRSRPASLLLCISVVLVVASPLSAGVITFEGYPDGTVLTTQYPGLTFANAMIITAGISLNEFEFPPHSGVNVAFDDGGPMTITFAAPLLSFGGYFTYAQPLTIDAFNLTGTLLTSATSAFSNNEALSDDPGSSPNEFLEVTSSGGISTITLIADPNGSSFTVDDVPITAVVPEPAAITLLVSGCFALLTDRTRRGVPR
ncbi:MAG TPA: hypothetical protein VMU45_10285 [Candidatus Eisenbacteria bacterium]|nr:hypothetical protein [Candidatus Eisenbacteria bacterium]